MSTLCHRSYCRGFQQHDHWCGCGILKTGGLHDSFQFNKCFASHVRYAAAFVSRLLMPDAQRAVKRILPPSAVSSTFDEEDHETSSEHSSCSSDQKTREKQDVELDEFQNELRDFIKNLRTPSTSDASVSTSIEAV